MESKTFSRGVGNRLLLIAKFIFVYLAFEVFYIYYYFNNTSWCENFSTFKTELNQTGQATIYYIYALSLTA
ncbi:MAG: hypothetical protein P4M11_02110 [Candidatus Pacebacteria bacterium]|nr:hypothetical protein [Candidatus Paceibacterota bacterium]